MRLPVSYFSDETRSPLLMRNLGHEWHSAEDLYV